MKLNIYERLVLVNVIPEKGNFDTMKMVENLRSLLYPNEEEIKEFEIVQDEKTVKWNAKAAEQRDIPLSVMEKALVIKQFEKLSKAEELNVDQYKVYQKFIDKTE